MKKNISCPSMNKGDLSHLILSIWQLKKYATMRIQFRKPAYVYFFNS